METQKKSTHLRAILPSFGLAVVLITGGGLNASAAEAPEPVLRPGVQSSSIAGDADRGEPLWFDYYCYSCHGTAGNGGAAPRISNSPRTIEGFIQYVRNPARMPPYINSVMSDQQLADVYQFMQEIPASPTVDEIPLLKELMESR